MDIITKKNTFKVKYCGNFVSQLFGFMFNNHKGYDGLLFDLHGLKSYSLHMLFVFVPLDIVYLDKEFKVLKVLKRVQPFVFHIPGFKCNYILELKDCKHLKIDEKTVVMR